MKTNKQTKSVILIYNPCTFRWLFIVPSSRRIISIYHAHSAMLKGCHVTALTKYIPEGWKGRQPIGFFVIAGFIFSGSQCRIHNLFLGSSIVLKLDPEHDTILVLFGTMASKPILAAHNSYWDSVGVTTIITVKYYICIRYYRCCQNPDQMTIYRREKTDLPITRKLAGCRPLDLSQTMFAQKRNSKCEL